MEQRDLDVEVVLIWVDKPVGTLRCVNREDLPESAVSVLVPVKAKRESVLPNLAARAATRVCAFLENGTCWPS